jgi:uncharacterized repeat protein (TIGR03803 family)
MTCLQEPQPNGAKRRLRVVKCFWTFAGLALIAVFASVPIYAQTYSVLYNFGSQPKDAANPVSSSVVQGDDGSLYATSAGGTQGTVAGGYGTVFKVTLAGREQVLYNFCSEKNCIDGWEPGGLILRPDGHLLGVTTQGGTCSDSACGTVFDLSEGGSLSTVYIFTGTDEEEHPYFPPIIGPDGQFYGTISMGTCGLAYKLTGSGVFYLLNNFGNGNGCLPGPLVLGTDGSLYGTSENGGTQNLGAFFKIIVHGNSGTATKLYSFNGTNGSHPSGALAQGSDGNFYGITADGGTSGFGVIFKITPTGALTVLHNMNGSTDGFTGFTGLMQASDGNFYGTANEGGTGISSDCPAGCGTLFRITPAGNFSVIHNRQY